MATSLIVPAYNEERRIKPFLNAIAQYHRRHPQAWREIIVVDDGSTDRTAALAASYQGRIPGLRLVQHSQNQGKGAAVQTGVLAARGDLVVFIDADGATDISELPKLVAALDDADIAVGNRWIKGSKTKRHSLLRRFAGWANRTYMRLFGLGNIDIMCGFKGYRRHVARELFSHLQEKRWLFDTEIAYRSRQKGYRIVAVPIQWESKEGSKLSTATLVKSAWQIWPLIRRLKKLER